MHQMEEADFFKVANQEQVASAANGATRSQASAMHADLISQMPTTRAIVDIREKARQETMVVKY